MLQNDIRLKAYHTGKKCGTTKGAAAGIPGGPPKIPEILKRKSFLPPREGKVTRRNRTISPSRGTKFFLLRKINESLEKKM